MEIQQKVIPQMLSGFDIIGEAKTGSGKTLAFLIPAIEILIKSKFKQRNGTGVLIISPIRELSLQTYNVGKKLISKHSIGVVIGGAPRKKEQFKLKKGINLLVATPGRLLDHLNNSEINISNLLLLIIDEADRILEHGFQETIEQIIEKIPKIRQTALFSATQTENVKDLIRFSFNNKPIYISVSKGDATVESLTQGYIICPIELRFRLLYKFLRSNRNKKNIVFFSSVSSVKYHFELFNYIDIPVIALHGKLSQQNRTTTFFQFNNAEKGTLLCTNVAARGLDIPDVDWIVQYDPPTDHRDYIHRVGRTARAGKKGTALIFLLTNEIGFLSILNDFQIPLKEYKMPKVPNIQSKLEQIVNSNYFLLKSSKSAFKSFIRAYESHHHKTIFNPLNLNLELLGKSFGLKEIPLIKIGEKRIGRRNRKKKKFNKFTKK